MVSELSAEDILRLNVMFAKRPQAIRIDESRMMVFAMTGTGEFKFALSPQGSDDTYLKSVRHFLSSQVLGSPGGYPVYLKRWTRMGQTRSMESLRKLLLLGEPEALAAVVHTPNLSSELAQFAWWVQPDADHARQMLASLEVAKSELAITLADFLVEFLPFETLPGNIIDSVRLVLQPGLISDEVKAELWRKGERKNIYYVGFLLALPDGLLDITVAHPDYPFAYERLSALCKDNPFAASLLQLLSAAGQQFLRTTAMVLKKPSSQDVCVRLFDAIEMYFLHLHMPKQHRDMQSLKNALNHSTQDILYLQELLTILPEQRVQICSMSALSMVSNKLLDEVFGLTDSCGSVMRKKIRHITEPMMQWLAELTTVAGGR